MTKIKIKTPENGNTLGTTVTTEDGQQIDGITKIAILPMTDYGLVRAEIELHVAALDITAHPLLGLDTLIASAAARGYVLTPCVVQGGL